MRLEQDGLNWRQKISNWLRRVMGDRNFYSIEGGGLDQEASTYVERPIDRELCKALKSSARHHLVCAILAPRQMGKTSLMTRTAHRLTLEKSAICVRVNLQGFGTLDSESALWFNLLRRICQNLKNSTLLAKLDQVWPQNNLVQPSHRFLEFLKDLVLPSLASKLVVFLDEIQCLVQWGLQDEVMGVFRSLIEEQESVLDKLAFVLVGVAKPSDLLKSSTTTVWNVGTSLTITGLTGDCEPLLEGLRDVCSDPATVMTHILRWTRGQPFLTQWVCQEVRNASRKVTEKEPALLVKQVVTDKIVTNWRQQDKQNHLHTIDHWFKRSSGHQNEPLGRIKLAALSLYRQLLQQQPVDFWGTDHQWDLLTSGLVVNEISQLRVTNPIYQSVFDLAWVERKEQHLKAQGVKMADLNKTIDRDTFMLIDQSGSMVRDDGGPSSRWQRLQEQCIGDINDVLNYDDNGQKICDQIIMMPYNVNRYRGNRYEIDSPAQADSFFLENQPRGNANVTPTLRKCYEEWLGEREKITAKEVEAGTAKGAMFVIYIDGQFDDSPAFEELVKEMCSRIDDQRIFKIVILGFGNEVNGHYFDRLDVNDYFDKQDSNKRKGKPMFKDANDKNCNVIVFELVDDFENEGVVEVMERQLLDPNTVRKNFGKYD